MMVLDYAKNGSLRNYLDTNYEKLNWHDKLEILCSIIYGLQPIHEYEVISGLPPYHDACHDQNLALKICQGLRPRFNIKVPQLIVHLIKKCLDANPLNRPTINEIIDILYPWRIEFNDQTELQKQIKE